MKVELTDISDCKKTLDIEIPQEVVDGEIATIARELSKRARVPGFRPGKAPVTIVKTRFREEIQSEMMQHLLPKYFSEAAEDRKLEVADGPRFEKIDYAGGQPLRFRALFEVYPQLKISNYKGIPAQEIPAVVEESEVDATLQRLQDENSELISIDEDRPVREGDFLEVSFQAVGPSAASSATSPVTSDDAPESSPESSAVQKAVVEIGGASTLKEFTENLLGMRVNEEKTFSVAYRPDYPTKKLAGTTVEYRVKAETLKEKKIPELTDEFAQGLGQFSTLADFRSTIRQDLEKHKREHTNEQVREKLLEWLEDHNEFEVPESMVERQIQIRMQRLVRDLSRQGVNPQRLDVDWGKIAEDQRQQSIKDVRGSLILDHVADTEQISAEDEEADLEIERIAEETNRPVEKVREVLGRDNGMERLKGQLRNKKTLDFLQKHAQFQPAESFDH